MATKKTIRKNIVTGEWEHYIEVPLFEDYHWAPGIYNYYGEFPIPETSESLMRNPQGFLLSYEDVRYTDYEVTTTRKLPTYTQLQNIYDIQFSELYQPAEPISITFKKRNANYEYIDVHATPAGGYPYRHPTTHYEFSWKAIEYDSRYLDRFNATSKEGYILRGIGIGKYELTITDANRISVTEVVEITQDDLLVRYVPPDEDNKPPFEVALWFWSDDPLRKTGNLRATVKPGTSEGPYTVEWQRGTGTVLNRVFYETFTHNQVIELGDSWPVTTGTYSIVITDQTGGRRGTDRQVATDTITITDANFPALAPGEDPSTGAGFGRDDADAPTYEDQR